MEAKLINNYFIGKELLLFYPVFQVFRINRSKEIKPLDAWVALNGPYCVYTTGSQYFCWELGHRVSLLLLSFSFAGCIPLARWIQGYFHLTHGEQETYIAIMVSLNTIALMVGFSTMNITISSSPLGNRPSNKIREEANRHLQYTFYHTPDKNYFFRFLFDKEISLFSRIVRKDRARLNWRMNKTRWDSVNKEAVLEK